MQLTSPNPSDSPQASYSPSSTDKRPAIRPRRHRRRSRRQPPPSPTPSSTSPHSSTPNNITENQFNSSYSSHPTNSTSSSSPPSPPIFLAAVVPLPLFRGLPGECPVSHLTLFNRLFPSSLPQISRNFAVTLLDDAALWHELAVEPHLMSWDETKSAFLRAFRVPEFAETARTELVSLRQGDGESINAYYLRMQWILRRWDGHGLPESLVRGLFVDGLREEFHDWVVAKKPETAEEAVEIAMDWEAATAGRRRGEARCGFCEGRHGEKECEARQRMREEWMRKKEEEEKLGRIVSIERRSQCQCYKHQCWKKYERSGSAVAVKTADAGDAAAATAEVVAAGGAVGGISSAERIGGTMMAVVGVFFMLVMLV